MDRIIKGYLNSFVTEFEYPDDSKILSKNFEKFCSYLILKNELPNSSIDENDINSMSIGDNKGIDSICYIVNGKLINDIKQVEDLLELNNYLEILLIFVQSKTSEKFDDSEIGNFGDTIKDFFSDSPKFLQTIEIKNAHEILIYLYDHFSDVKKFNSLAYYCSTGKWNDNTTCNQTIIIKNEEIIKDHGDKFKNGNFSLKPKDRVELQRLFEKVNSPISAEFEFLNKIPLSSLSDFIDDAYYGTLPFSEYKKIIIDSETDNLRNLFYDNVRDDLGEKNPVNSEISKTITNKEIADFVLLNNGVTIIAEENKGGGNKFILDNFQIVNGCQTSNVLYRYRNEPDIDNLIIPVKLIITKNEIIKDKIIIATNKQTEIKEEQLMALSTFQKGLEKFYETVSHEIHYERRINQYAGKGYKKKCIVNLREQIKSFVAIFLEEPHLVSGYFGRTFREKKDKIFLENHKFEPYYFSGLIQYNFKNLLNRKEIDRKYNKVRYHIFMLFRKIFEPNEFNINLLQQKKIIQYTDELVKKLDNKNINKNFKKAIDIVDKAGVDIENPKEIYKKSTTNAFLDKYNEIYK